MDMNTELLLKAAAQIKTGYELMGSKWGNCESEVIMCQTLAACAKNLQDHGEALSWAMPNCWAPKDMHHNNNARGLQRLMADGDLVVEDYTGKLTPAKGVKVHKGFPQVFKITEQGLHYCLGLTGTKNKPVPLEVHEVADSTL